MKGKMSFEEFTDLVRDNILNCLPERFKDAEVKLQTVTKNNNLKLTGLTVLLPERNMAPTIYLEEFYKKYEKGEHISYILEEIADIHIEHEVQDDFDTSMVTDFERCKDKIYPRLVSMEWNDLEEYPHVEMEDLAVIFNINLGADEHGSMGIKVHHGLMNMWKVGVDELYQLSLRNLERENNTTFKSMRETMVEILLPDAVKEYDGDVYEARRCLEALLPPSDTLYVLSNTSKAFGANAVLDNNMMESIVEEFGDIYILPSSVHELLIVPADAGMEVSRLRSMVEDVNSTVNLEERLSNNVYTYNLIDGLKIA